MARKQIFESREVEGGSFYALPNFLGDVLPRWDKHFPDNHSVLGRGFSPLSTIQFVELVPSKGIALHYTGRVPFGETGNYSASLEAIGSETGITEAEAFIKELEAKYKPR